MSYFGYVVKAINENEFKGVYEEIDIPEIKDDEVLIKTHYSSLNYKDALAATGVKGVVKEYPFIPGIDVAGEVIESNSKNFLVGDLVIATGYKLGMSVNGGFGQLVALPSNWIVKLPDGLSFLSAMEIGTAGLTAAASATRARACTYLPPLTRSGRGRSRPSPTAPPTTGACQTRRRRRVPRLPRAGAPRHAHIPLTRDSSTYPGTPAKSPIKRASGP